MTTSGDGGVTFEGKEICDSVFEFRPQDPINYNIEFVFFHGLTGDWNELGDAYFRTWVTQPSGNKQPEIWPGTLLIKEFPYARVLAVKYDASAKKTQKAGVDDEFNVAENLAVQLITFAHVGQRNAPVVFVTHCLGAIVARKLIVHIHSKSRLSPNDRSLTDFLHNFRGILDYSPALLGSRQYLEVLNSIEWQGELVKFFHILCEKAARLLQSFQDALKSLQPPTRLQYTVQESWETHRGGFKGKVVEEASARVHNNHRFITVAEDHFSVCQPKSKTSNNFQFLCVLAQEIQKGFVYPTHDSNELPASQEDPLVNEGFMEPR